MSGRTRAVVIFLDRLIYRLTHHWIAFVNVALALYLVPAFAAPLLLAGGYETPSRFIYMLYGPPVCHQLPERSFYLFGLRPAYTLDELVALGAELPAERSQRRLFVGNPNLGYKMALCQRDIALYGGIILCGVAYALWGRRRLKSLSWKVLLLFAAPLVLDGVTQLLGLRESTPVGRVATGLLAAAGGVWFIYPTVELTMLDLRHSVATKLHLPE